MAGDDGSLVWRRANPWDTPVECGCLYPFGVLIFSLALPLPLWVTGGVAAALVAAGVYSALFAVNTVEFTAHQVVLTSRVVARTREFTDLAAVEVGHSGYEDTGYNETTLVLTWRNRRTSEVPGAYDLRLADALRRGWAWGDRVREVWYPLGAGDVP